MNITLPHDWQPRIYQRKLWSYMQGAEEGKRAVCVWHRRAGKDLTALNLCAYKAFQRVGTYWHVLPTYQQGRKIVWFGATREGRRFLDFIPKQLIRSKNNTEMRIELKNNSLYQVVGTDNIDALVGTNPVGVVFSEYSLQNPAAWNYIRPILAENGGWAVFIYTPRGKNHGHNLWKMAEKNHKWFGERLVAGNSGTKREDGSPVVSDEIIQDERDAGMAEELIRQEFFVDFEAPIVGAYYANQMSRALADGHITKVPHEPKLPVDTYWDIGVGDSTAIWFVQSFRGEHRIIDYYEKSGEGLPYFAKLIKGQLDGYNRMAEYTYKTHFAPHDIEVREWAAGGKSRVETAREMGIRFRTVPIHRVEDGIEAVRNVLPTCWFDEENCDQGIQALRSYTKEWDEKRKMFRANPKHDWSSHGADSFRIFGMAYKRSNYSGVEKRPTVAKDDFSYV